MKANLSLLLGLAASCASASVIEKRSSNSWAGTNNYYVHGLSASDQASYISTLKSYGTKVVRLWGTSSLLPPFQPPN